MKHTTRLTACLLALALTACTAAPQIFNDWSTTEIYTLSYTLSLHTLFLLIPENLH